MKKVRAKIDDLVTSGVQPVVTKGGSVVMRSGKKSVTLQRPGGKFTSAGKYFESRGGSIPGADTGYNGQQVPERRQFRDNSDEKWQKTST